MKWRVSWRVRGEAHQEEFVYRYNAREWARLVQVVWGVEAAVEEVLG